MRRLFVDTNVLVRIVVYKELELLEHMVGAEPFTSVSVLEEAAYKVIALSILEAEGRVLSAYQVRRKFAKGVARNLIERRLEALNRLAERLTVVAPTLEDFEESKRIALEYSLLPNDALIAAIMKRRNIATILTLDSDFRKIPWLRVVP